MSHMCKRIWKYTHSRYNSSDVSFQTIFPHSPILLKPFLETWEDFPKKSTEPIPFQTSLVKIPKRSPQDQTKWESLQLIYFNCKFFSRQENVPRVWAFCVSITHYIATNTSHRACYAISWWQALINKISIVYAYAVETFPQKCYIQIHKRMYITRIRKRIREPVTLQPAENHPSGYFLKLRPRDKRPNALCER